jgi:hypothetical protein
VKVGYGRDNSAGIATTYRLGSPGSIPGISSFSFILFSYVLLIFPCINVLAFCILYYLCITVYVLFVVYVTLPRGISPIAICYKLKYKYMRSNAVAQFF